MRNLILKASSRLAMITLLISFSALDSDSNIPIIVAIVSLAYLGIYIYANYED